MYLPLGVTELVEPDRPVAAVQPRVGRVHGTRSGPLQDRVHDREVARCNHTQVAGETVELGIVAGPLEPTTTCTPLHVLLDCGTADVVDEDIDLRGLQRLRLRGVDGPVALRRCRVGQSPRPAADRDTPQVKLRSSAASIAAAIGGAVQPVTPAKQTLI